MPPRELAADSRIVLGLRDAGRPSSRKRKHRYGSVFSVVAAGQNFTMYHGVMASLAPMYEDIVVENDGISRECILTSHVWRSCCLCTTNVQKHCFGRLSFDATVLVTLHSVYGCEQSDSVRHGGSSMPV